MEVFQVIDSTLDSLNEYQYRCKDFSDLKKRKIITLVNPKTKQAKRFRIDYIKGNSEYLTLKNSNITIALKRSI